MVDALVAQTVSRGLPAAQQIQQFLRSHPGFGSKDRARISDEFWAALRKQPLPGWMSEGIRQAIGDAELEDLLAALSLPGSLDLRVNIFKCKVEQALLALRADGLCVDPSHVVAEALHVQGKPNIEKSQAYGRGMVEVQDLGSQLLARLAYPKRGQLVVDFCAGAGGKALAIAAALRGSGKVYALDVSSTRLARLSPRLERSGLKNIWPIVIRGLDDARLSALRQRADVVLVDAPCSGTGTLRRSPDLKWRLTPDRLNEFPGLQTEILSAAARLVRPGGRLVYATCSLFPCENAAVVERFLAEHAHARRVPAQEVLKGQGVRPPESWGAWSCTGDLALWPHRTGTDGFYAAVIALGGGA